MEPARNVARCFFDALAQFLSGLQLSFFGTHEAKHNRAVIRDML